MVNVAPPGGGTSGGSALGLLQAGLMGGGPATASTGSRPGSPVVWLGDYTTKTVAGGRRVGNPVPGKPLPDGVRYSRVTVRAGAIPVEQAALSIRAWPVSQQKALARKLWYLGYPQVGSPDDVFGAISVWEIAVNEAAKSQAAGSSITPNQVLDLYANGYTSNLAKRQQQQNLAGVQVQKQRQINLTDPLRARALITQAFQGAYGRDPTDAEVRVLTATLNKKERSNPVVSTTTTQTDAAGNPVGAASTVTAGGFAASDYLDAQTKADPAAAEYRASANYFPALMQMLGAPV